MRQTGTLPGKCILLCMFLLMNFIMFANPAPGIPRYGSAPAPPPCVNPTDGGTISAEQSGLNPFDPAELTGTSPSGYSGVLEYQWQSSTNNSTFIDIGSASSSTYDPGSLTVTTWFRRLARVSCIGTWVGATTSNTLKITVITRRYVTQSGAGSKNGTSWANAYDKDQLQTAINETGVTEVWVAQGTYNPSLQVGGSGSRYRTFQLKNGVSVYGGFYGNESQLLSRDIQGYPAILSGDMNNDDNYTVSPWTGTSENCYHVFYHPNGLGLTSAALLDGFIIKGGNANGSDPHTYGGGMYNNNNSPTLSSIKFVNNAAAGNAGAMYNISSGNVIVNGSEFTNNKSSITSGAVNNNACAPVFSSCIFDGNTTVYGGGAVVNESNATVTFKGCTFKNNAATNGTGGAAFEYIASVSYVNCLFYNNTAAVYGGAIYNTNTSSLSMTNCTMYGNSSQYGGAVYTNGNSCAIYNSIIWGNTFTSGTNQGRQIYYESGTNTLQNSCFSNLANDVDGSFTPTACINGNPLFVLASGHDFRIYGLSPCTDAGNNTFITETEDIRGPGYGRKLDKSTGLAGTVDMGAVEFKYGTDPHCESTVEVTNLNDDGDGSLRNALAIVCDNGTITFNASLNGQTITLTSGQLVINKGVTMNASALSSGINVSGNAASRIFYADAAGKLVTLNKVKMINGTTTSNGGGIYINAARKVSLFNGLISGCTADAGAGIFMAASDTVQLTGTTIQNGNAANGGGIKQQSGVLIFSNSTIKSNNATYQGGGLFQTGGTMTSSGSVFKTNSALWGAGIYLESGSAVMTNDSVSSNTAIGSGSAGGGVYQKQGTLSMNNCIVNANTSVNYGAGFYIETASATTTFNGGKIQSNIVSNGSGGGWFIGNGTVRIRNNAKVKYNAANRTTASSDGGGIFMTSGSLTIDTSFINNNTAYRYGGGIYVGNSDATLTARGDSVSNNSTTTDAGAGIYIGASAANLKRIIVSGNNNGNKGAGMFILGPSNNVTVDSCTFRSNITKNASSDINYGGGIFVNNSTVTISNSTFTGNKATNTSNLRTPKGGAIYLFQGSLTSNNNTFTSNVVNTTKGLGGGFFNDQGTATLNGCTFTTDSTGRNGGAIYTNAAASTTNVTTCTFTGNYAENLGGAIFVNNGTLNTTSSTFDANKAHLTNGAAAGIYQNNSTTTTKACIFKNNRANSAGGFNIRTGTANIINCLFYDNNVTDHGGAITSELGTANLNIINSTIAFNNAPTNGGGLGIQNGVVSVKNSIIWGNTSTSGAQIKSTATSAITLMNSDYGNLSGDISGTVTPTSSITSHPNFVSEVGRDFRLGGNSPCLDAGNNTYCTEAFDIRGSSFARKLDKTNGTLAGTIDMGAYEYKHTSDPITGCTNPTSGGAIARNQTGCSSLDPAALTDSVSPTGYYGTLEYKWQKSTTSASSGFADISGASTSTYDPGALTANTWFKRLSRVACMATWTGAGESNVVAITVYSTLTAGSISANQSICYNTTPTQMTGTAPTGGKTPYNYQWQSSADNVNFSNISGSTGLTYAPGALTATTYYRLLQTSDYCGTVATNVVTKTVYGEFVAGTAGSDQSICQNSSPVTLTGVAPTGGNLPYSYLWQSSPDNTTFSDISGQTSTTYQPGAMTISTWYRQKQVSSGGCGTLYTNSVHIEVEPTPVSGSLTKSPALTTVCEGTDVSASLTSGSGGNGTDVLEYRTETISGWSSWIAYTSGNSINTTGKINVEIRTYRDADHCSNGSTITKSWAVSTETVGGTLSGGQNVCTGSNSTLLTLTGYTGTIQSWKQSTDGTSWTVISGATASTYTAIDVNTNTWYKVIVQSGVCPSDSTNTTQITVSDFSISGYAKYENNPKTPLDGLKITLKKNGAPVGSPVVTNSTGYYIFTGLVNGTYSLEIASAFPGGQWQTWGGVNMTDALLVNNHISGSMLLPSNPPVVQITASVKLPHPAIQTNDYTAIRYAAKSGWGFFDIPKWVFSGLTASEGLTNIVMNCSNITRDIRGLCAGDVNGTYVPLTGNKAAGIDPKGSLNLHHVGELPMTDELVFPVKAGADMDLGALSLNLSFNPDQLIINRITYTSEPDEDSYFTSENGLLSIGYLPKNPAHVKKNQTVLLIHATLIKNADKQLAGSPSEFRFDLSGTAPSELADPDGNVIGDALFLMPVASTKGTFSDARAISVYPNPARSEVYVGLSVENVGTIDYELLSITGQIILKSSQIIAQPGYNEIRMGLEELSNGVYLVRVTTANEQMTRKLIINH